MHTTETKSLPPALSLLSSERPRNVNWFQAAALLFGDWGTSRLYVLGLAFLVAGRSSFWLIAAMSLLILAVGWAYTQICRIYPDGGGVYTAGRAAQPAARRHRGAAALRRLHRHRSPQRRRCVPLLRPRRTRSTSQRRSTSADRRRPTSDLPDDKRSRAARRTSRSGAATAPGSGRSSRSSSSARST